MIDKRLIVIVLAIGLILSIGYVVGQMEIAPRLGALQEVQPLQNPSVRPSISLMPGLQVETPSAIIGDSEHPGMASMVPSLNEPENSNLGEMPISWNGVSPRITSYTIDHYVSGDSPKYLANIACFESGGKIVGHIAFINDDIYEPTYYLEVLELSDISEILQEKYWSHVILLTFPYSRYNDIIDLFRNDREIRLYYDLDSSANSPSGGIVSSNTVMPNAF